MSNRKEAGDIIAAFKCSHPELGMQGDFYLGAWLVQPSLGRVSLDDRTVQVRPKVMDLLVYLAQSPGVVISKETLLNSVWGTEAISESALTRTITELRNAVGDDVDQPRFLETIPKRGYRLIAPIRPVAMPEPDARTRPAYVLAIWIAIVLAVVASTAFLVFTMVRKDETTVLHVRPLTSLPGQESQPDFSPDGRQIAFAWSGISNDNLDVYVKRLGEDSPIRLTTSPEPDLSPVWSRDGRAIAFVRGSKGDVEVHVVAAEGGTESRVAKLRRFSAPVRPRALDWSHDGRALFVVEQDSPQTPFYIIRLSIESGESYRLTSPPPHSGDTQPVVSPDGRTLAFTRSHAPGSSDIYLLPLGGGEPHRLTFDDQVISGLTWSADGASIVLSSERGAMASSGSLWRVRVNPSTIGDKPEQLRGIGPRAMMPVIARQGNLLAYQEYYQDTNLWRAPTTGTEAPQLVVSSTREENHPDLSPDGKRIAFGSNRSGNWEIWIADADGSNERRVTSYGAAPAAQPRWSPNGRLLVFHHIARGNSDIYTITPEGSTPRQLTSEPSAEETASWSKDRRWIYFSSNRSGVHEIWKLEVDQPTQPLQVTRNGGTNPREAADRVFYSKRTGAGFEVWSTGVTGGDETRVLGPVRSLAGWTPDPNGIYFIEPTGRISYYRFSTGETTPIVPQPKESNPYNPGLTLSPDGRWLLYGQMDRFGADIMLVENFQ